MDCMCVWKSEILQFLPWLKLESGTVDLRECVSLKQ
jgi:hypothetical protein